MHVWVVVRPNELNWQDCRRVRSDPKARFDPKAVQSFAGSQPPDAWSRWLERAPCPTPTPRRSRSDCLRALVIMIESNRRVVPRRFSRPCSLTMSTITKRLSVEQYEAMIENGILRESNRFELIEGKLVER